jgi:hypothetical protein
VVAETGFAALGHVDDVDVDDRVWVLVVGGYAWRGCAAIVALSVGGVDRLGCVPWFGEYLGVVATASARIPAAVVRAFGARQRQVLERCDWQWSRRFVG